MAVNGAAPPNHVENGREFHGWRPGLYMYPCDEPEKDRMDVFHTLFLIARHGKLHKFPIYPNNSKDETRILDVGTGTGIWAIDVAEYTSAEVIGIDLANIQPVKIPPNLRFRVPRDYEGVWTLGQNSFDLIHMRMAYGGVSAWSDLYMKIFDHLKPGDGWFEQVEIDFEPRCDDGPIPETYSKWWEWLTDATMRGSKPIQYDHNTAEHLRSRGFVDVEETVIRLPLNTWPADPHDQDVGRWYNIAFVEGIEAMSLGPFTRVYQWPAADVRRLAGEVKEAVCPKRYHLYNNLFLGIDRRSPDLKQPYYHR